MKVKFNKFEKAAGLFVIFALVGFLGVSVAIAVKKGWLSSKRIYRTELETAEGVYPGTLVQMAGLRAGDVLSVELVSQDRVRVKFEVLSKFASKIREDSVVRVFRPFVLGEKVLEVSVGSPEVPVLAANSKVPLEPTMDVMDLLSGRKMSSFLGSMDKMADSLKIFTEAFADPQRTRALIKAFDRINPLIRHMDTMSQKMSEVASVALKKKRFETMMSNLAEVSEQMNQILPAFSKEAPDAGKQLAQVVKNMNVLTEEFKKLTPAITALAPDLPQTTRRAVEALDQAVILLKGMQKSFLFRGGVREVLKEEQRTPASDGKPK